MTRTLVCCMALLLLAGAARGEESDADKLLPGMSILGNDDAPKSLVIVPWKGSGLGDTLDLRSILGDGRQPVDRDVFMRELNYYEIRAGSSTTGGSGHP